MQAFDEFYLKFVVYIPLRLMFALMEFSLELGRYLGRQAGRLMLCHESKIRFSKSRNFWYLLFMFSLKTRLKIGKTPE